jgi:hypothetical protein
MRFTVCRFVTSCFARGMLVACGPMEMRSELTQLVSAINTFDYLHLPGDTPTETGMGRQVRLAACEESEAAETGGVDVSRGG